MTYIYTGDIDIKQGGMFLNIAEFKKWGDFCPVIKITDLDSACGFEGGILIQSGSIYCPIEDQEKLKSALECCCYVMTSEGLNTGREVLKPDSEFYWILIAECFDAYHGIELDIGGEVILQIDPDSPMESREGWVASERVPCLKTWLYDNYGVKND